MEQVDDEGRLLSWEGLLAGVADLGYPVGQHRPFLGRAQAVPERELAAVVYRTPSSSLHRPPPRCPCPSEAPPVFGSRPSPARAQAARPSRMRGARRTRVFVDRPGTSPC